MASLSLPIPAEQQTPQPRHTTPDVAPVEGVVLVAGFGNAVALDYAAYLSARRVATETGGSSISPRLSQAKVSTLILFVGPRLSSQDRSALDVLIGEVRARRPQQVFVVGSFRVHLKDQEAATVENHVVGQLKGISTIVFRTGHVLSPHSHATSLLRRYGFCRPLVPTRMRSCCVEGNELFESLEAERQRPHAGRIYTLLGPNKPWKEFLAAHGKQGIVSFFLRMLSFLLALFCIGHLAAFIVKRLARHSAALRSLTFDTLRPASFRELLALYNKYNYHHVKVVGYNNGVIHFGQKFPRKTVVSTVHCNRVRSAGSDVLKADCGATIRKAMDFLSPSGRELYVIPNYSYVCLGTAFFVPIHGSASDYSTVAETMVKAVLYDPLEDRLIVATRDDPAFRERVYDLKSPTLLLRLSIKVKPKARYYVHREEVDEPTSAMLLTTLQDEQASNVEIRKSQAGCNKVRISRYFQEPGQTQSPVLEIPRDALGRLWDRLEENPITSFLMHSLTRYFAWHVELFFTAEEFTTFWATHHELPLRKMQLRYIRRDGLPKSPFRDHACVSVDMFMFRLHRRKFEAYLKKTFTVVRSNPGKHSG